MAATKKGGLGRGLDALLDPYVQESIDQSSDRKVLEVDIYSIDPNKEQPRKNFAEEPLKELAASIATHGIVQPLIVRNNGDRYTIVAGERRYRAARLAKLKTVPVITVDYDDARMQEVALIENIQRENLNPIEEASAIRFLMQQHDLTQEEVSARLGKSRPAVTNSLRLLNLPKNITELVKDGTLSAGHGRALAGISDEETLQKLTTECLRLGYSVRSLESRIRNLNETSGDKKRRKKRIKTLSADMKAAEQTLIEKLGTKVSLVGSGEKGQIVIEYFSAEDLNRLYELLTGQEE